MLLLALVTEFVGCFKRIFTFINKGYFRLVPEDLISETQKGIVVKTSLIACVYASGLILGFSSVTLAQPDDAIKKHIDKNGAFAPCNPGAITNGHVVFGDNSAIVNLSGAASDNANTETSAVDDPEMANTCGIDESQRVEPRSWWYSLARVINRATAISRKRAD